VPDVRVLTTAEASSQLLAAARILCDRAFDGGFSDEDWAHSLGGWHALVVEGAAVVSHASVVPRDLFVDDRPFRTGYVEAVATEEGRRRSGLGTLVMMRIADVIRQHMQMGALSTGHHRFYERLGWERWRGPTYVREGDRLLRTEDEDRGVMVLRHGPGATVDLTAAIACPARAGDDW